ncbi:MAG: DUF87 domain-containing protein [Desulfurococcales archaeon]|nr:DUF87 domain-containing protein [Desulfurococcales archaeon]
MEKDKKDLGTLLGGLGSSGLAERLDEMYRRAYGVAEELGTIVGRTTRYWDITVGPGETIKIEVDPETYYSGASSLYRIGDYLAVIDPKTLNVVLLRITHILRQDALAKIGVEPPISQYSLEPDTGSVATSTIIEAEPLMEARYPDLTDPSPASSSIEPQSPVIDPRPWVIMRLLALPDDGILLGSLAHPAGIVKNGEIPVYLPYKAVLQHILVLGTTGSGKTTLIKNMISSIYSVGKPKLVAVIIDMNQDYVQLPFPPRRESQKQLYKDPVYEANKGRLRHPRGVLVVLPVTVDMLRSPGDPLHATIRKYVEESISPLIYGRDNFSIVRVKKGGIEYYMVDVVGTSIIITPYTINTTMTGTENLFGMIPGMTMFARDLLRVLRTRFHKDYGFYPPLPTVLAAVKAYLSTIQSKSRVSKDLVLDSAKDIVIERMYVEDYDYTMNDLENAYASYKYGDSNITLIEIVDYLYDILARMRPHTGTLESLYRRLAGALESGLIDIIHVDSRSQRVSVRREPSWKTLIDIAEEGSIPIVIDLKPALDAAFSGQEGSRLIAYRLLDRLAVWKQRVYRERKQSPPVLVVVDEAHQFFPQEHGSREEQEATRQIASTISRIARLGRARGIGLLFASHSPRDLHDIILQLANTKIILRTERHQLERLDIDPDYKRYIPRLRDRQMIVQSHVFRETAIMARTCPPVALHFDISALIS